MLLDEKVSRISTVVKDHVGLPVLPAGDALVDTPPVSQLGQFKFGFPEASNLVTLMKR